MSLLVIPTDSIPSYSQSVALEGANFTVQFDYNQRCASWYMSIADQDGEDIYNGVKLVVGIPLLRKCKDERRPGFSPDSPYSGDFIVTSSTADTSPPSLLDLLAGSGRCTLYYITSDWVEALATGQTAGILQGLAAGGSLVNPVSTYGKE
jgi:hypothetical protein